MNVKQIGTVKITVEGYTHTDWPKWGLFNGENLVATALSANALSLIRDRGNIERADRVRYRDEVTFL